MKRKTTWWVALGLIVVPLIAGCPDDDDDGGMDGGADTGPKDMGTDSGTDSGVDTGVDGGTDSGLPTNGPTTVTMVIEGGTNFQRPGDAVSSPDGTTFYFTAYTVATPPQAGVFSVGSDGSGFATLHAGDPFAALSGMVMSCDGATLFIADMAIPTADELAGDGEDSDRGRLFTLATAGGAPAEFAATGIAVPSGLALSTDCTTLYVTGWTEAGVPALFTVPIAGGAATVVKEGPPLISPTGVHVDSTNVAWVMDHVGGGGANGGGILYAIQPNGDTMEVVRDLSLGLPGGVSLAAGGVTAVMPAVDEDGNGVLVTANTASSQTASIAAPAILDPAGIRTARERGVFVIVDSEGAIFRAE